MCSKCSCCLFWLVFCWCVIVLCCCCVWVWCWCWFLICCWWWLWCVGFCDCWGCGWVVLFCWCWESWIGWLWEVVWMGEGWGLLGDFGIGCWGWNDILYCYDIIYYFRCLVVWFVDVVIVRVVWRLWYVGLCW